MGDLELFSVASFGTQGGLDTAEMVVAWLGWSCLVQGTRGGTAAEQTLRLGKRVGKFTAKPGISSGSCGGGC